MANNQSVFSRLDLWLTGRQNKSRIRWLAQQVSDHAHLRRDMRPVIFFNASSRLTGLSLNAAFTSLTAWSLRLADIPVIHFVCQAGMKHCMLGTNRQDYKAPPPCESCITQSRLLYSDAKIQWFTYHEDSDLAAILDPLSVDQLSTFEYPYVFTSIQSKAATIPLGDLVLPTIRWALRRHHLPGDEQTRYLLRSYILSSYSIAREFASLLEKVDPSTVVVFNGSPYPEATARWVARELGIRVITHEVGFQPLSAFYTDGQATAYPISIPDDFELSAEQNQQLDAYLEKRFQGNFTMAGIRFWPEMRGLDDTFLDLASGFKQIVPIFTNVVYDTSQVHANVVFPHMFAWLDCLLGIFKEHPETLFVIRAHPDEMRIGTAKIANESVQDWVINNDVDALDNVIFIKPTEYVSSYELIHRSKFVIVYNSSIGLEATLLGKAVVCGGRARYTQYPTVYFPETQQGFKNQVEAFLAKGKVDLRPEFQRNARRFLYYQLYRTSLPLDEYLEPMPRQGFVLLKAFPWSALKPENSVTMRVIHDGIVGGSPFLLPE